MKNLYQCPFGGQVQADYDKDGNVLVDAKAQEDFDNFYEDVYCELWRKYGPLEELNVCGNLGEHIVGNVYAKFRREEDASAAMEDLNKRWYKGHPIYAELSPVTDFREACCRQFEIGGTYRRRSRSPPPRSRHERY